jgi:hypothetical protein
MTTAPFCVPATDLLVDVIDPTSIVAIPGIGDNLSVSFPAESPG